MSAATPSVQPVVKFNVSAVPEGRESIAQLVVALFAEAGFGALQQLAALANAIGESDLTLLPSLRPRVKPWAYFSSVEPRLAQDTR